MRLPQPFHRLSIKFDAARMREEIERIPSSAWAEHPNGIPGNSSLRLISVNGEENDEVNGRMAMTPHLAQSPYLRQVLDSFGVVWGRSRLMRLAPGASGPGRFLRMIASAGDSRRYPYKHIGLAGSFAVRRSPSGGRPAQ